MSVVANVAINVDAANAIQNLKRVDQAAKGLNSGLQAAEGGAKGFGAALQSALGPLLAVSTAIGVLQKGLSTAFERGAAEQRLKNLTSSAGEYEAALGAAASTSSKFGISQTEATGALADVYGRLKGVGFGLKETTQIYEGFNVAAKQSGVSGAAAAGVFFQLSQALGKGKLNGDEFVAVAERMPQLMDLIAQETGKSRGELATMAQQGQITSDVLYRALATAAQGATDLNGKLTAQQQAMNQLAVISDKLLNSIGQAFGPTITAAVGLLVAAGQKLSEWWDYLGSVVFPRVASAVQPVVAEMQKIWNSIPWDTLLGYLQGALLLAIENVLGAIKLIVPVLTFILQKWQELAANPVFQFIAEQVQRLAGFLGISSTAVSDFTAKQAGAKDETAKTVDQYSKLPPQIDNAKDKAKELKEAQTAVTKQIEASTAAIDKMAATQVAGVERILSVTNARIEAEKAVNNVLLEQAQRQLDGANSQGERVKAAGRILELTIEQAKLEKESAYATIEAEKIKLEIAVSSAKLKEQEVKLAVELARVQGTVLQAHYDTLNAATELVNQAIKQRDAGAEIAKYQKQTADASFKGAEAAAKAAYQSNITIKTSGSVATNIAKAATSADNFAKNLERGAKAADKAAKSVGSFPAFAGAGAIKDEATRNAMMQQFTQIEANRPGQMPFQPAALKPVMSTAGMSLYDRDVAAFAATVQSIVQAENAPQSATKVSPQINITTGPVIRQDNQDYVTMSDLESAMQQTATGVITSLQTPAGRYATGIR